MTNEGVQLPAPDDPRAPKYWLFEQGGELGPAMTRYLQSQPLTDRDIVLIRAYFRQWINSPVWEYDPHKAADSVAALARLRAAVDELKTAGDIRVWAAMASAEGIDPL